MNRIQSIQLNINLLLDSTSKNDPNLKYLENIKMIIDEMELDD